MIHCNIFCLFLILLISSWDVAASIVTEETDVGVAVFVTSVSGLRFDVIAAILSACSLVRCCSQQ